MGSVVSTIASVATKVYYWGVSCWQAAANVFKIIWQSFVNFMSRLGHFIGDQFSRLRVLYCYSNQTTRVSSSTSQDGLTQRTEVDVQQKNIKVEVRYNQDDVQFIENQEEKRKALENMEAARVLVDKAVDIMKKDLQAANPAASEKAAVEIQNLMNGNDVHDLIARMGSAPVSLT